MKPVKFLGINTVLGENQQGVLRLPAYREEGDSRGRVVTCWELDEAEIELLLKTKKVWLMQSTFNHPLQPVAMSVEPMVTFPETEN